MPCFPALRYSGVAGGLCSIHNKLYSIYCNLAASIRLCFRRPAATTEFRRRRSLVPARLNLLQRRLPPLGSSLSLQQHIVTQGERLDQIAFTTLADPEQFWRIADANTEMNALKLTAKAGRLLQIPFGGSL